MNYTYLYEYNQERYKSIGERKLEKKADLSVKIVENGYLLPARNAERRLFGHGGVLSEEKQYIQESQITAYAKYMTYPNGDDYEIYLGEGYDIENCDICEIEGTVIYAGYLSNHWGHFLIDSMTRIYCALEDSYKDAKIAFLVDEGKAHQMITNIKRFFELLGIEDRIVLINRVTKCEKIVIPEQAYQINGYYSEKYIRVFERVASAVDLDKYKTYDNVYFTRSRFSKAQSTEIGEEILVHIFEKNGFEIISPEHCSLDEQIAIIRKSKQLAGIIGTIAHNMLFANENQKMIILNKTYNLNMAQMDINIMRQLDITYIDMYMARYPVQIGNGPFLLYYSQQLDMFLRDMGWERLSKELLSAIDERKQVKTYEKMYRAKNYRNLHMVYPAQENRFDFFPTEHIRDYYERYYDILWPLKISEKFQVFCSRVKNRIRKK